MIKPFSFGLLLISSTSFAKQPTYQIDITLPVIEQGQYHRPYVALWIEDEQRVAQRSVLVWMKKDKWLVDLKRYWRRVARANRPIVDGVTGATKGAGTHTIMWDGLDDQGNPLPSGNYSVCLEAAREKGGREAICTKIAYGKTTLAKATGKHELTSLVVQLN